MGVKVIEGRSSNYRVDDCDWLIPGSQMYSECEQTLSINPSLTAEPTHSLSKGRWL